MCETLKRVSQAAFYGYPGALEGWRRLQADALETSEPLALCDYLPWVRAEPRFAVTKASEPRLAAHALWGDAHSHASLEPTDAVSPEQARERLRDLQRHTHSIQSEEGLVVLVDGVVFQRQASGRRLHRDGKASEDST